MMPRINLVGQRFGRLIVIAFVGRRNRTSLWLCGCDCGEATCITTGNLRARHSLSCGCYRKEYRRRECAGLNRSHGMSGTPTYMSWRAMLARCLNPNGIKYSYYGGRGVTVCDRWRNSFEAFLADVGERPLGKTLDRIDPYGNYEPGNCRWATPKEQALNTRRRKDLEND